MMHEKVVRFFQETQKNKMELTQIGKQQETIMQMHMSGNLSAMQIPSERRSSSKQTLSH